MPQDPTREEMLFAISELSDRERATQAANNGAGRLSVKESRFARWQQSSVRPEAVALCREAGESGHATLYGRNGGGNCSGVVAWESGLGDLVTIRAITSKGQISTGLSIYIPKATAAEFARNLLALCAD